MATYRPVHRKIWKDPEFQEYGSHGKLIFLYLITNESTTESGIYTISLRTIANETEIPIEIIKEYFETDIFSNVDYDKDNKLVFVRKFKKYNGLGSPRLVIKSIQKDCKLTKQSWLWEKYVQEYPEDTDIINEIVNGS